MIYLIYISWIILHFVCTALAIIALMLIYFFILERLKIYYRNWKIKKRIRQLEKEHDKYLQRCRKRELHEAEKRKYPLFYLKEGII